MFALINDNSYQTFIKIKMTLQDLFFDSVLKYPKNKCCIYNDLEKEKSWTYEELEYSIKNIKSRIESVIGSLKCYFILHLNISETTIIILLSVMATNCPFYILPSEGEESLDDIARNLNAGWILSNIIFNPRNCSESSIIEVLDEKIHLWKTDYGKEAGNFAYAVQTSGSTGVPKLIQVPHESILPNVIHLREIFEIEETDVVSLLSPLTFDPSIVEIFLALSSGAALFFMSERLKNKKAAFYDSMDKNNISVMQTTPSLYKRSLNGHVFFTRNSSLKTLVLGGEKFPSDFKRWDILNKKDFKLFNIYGITEVSCWASCRKVWPSDCDDNVDIGSPLRDTVLKIENDGELFIGSSKRICYIDSEDIKYQKNIFRATGDLFEVIDGKYYFLNRKEESSFKRFGIKINTNLVEKISSESNFGTYAVWISVNSEHILGLFLQTPDIRSFKNWLQTQKSRFPKGHWPDLIIKLDEIPLSKHGKLDRSILKQILKENYLKMDKSKETFDELWMHYTNSKIIESSSFTASGGDSIGALQFSSVINSEDLFGSLLSDSSYLECLNFFQKRPDFYTKRKTADESVAIRKKKCEYFLKERIFSTCEVFYNDFKTEPKLELIWRYNLKKCIDSTPLGIIFNKKELVIVASHSGIVIVFDVESGRPISEVVLPDRVESSPCLASDQNSFLIGCYDGCVYCIELKSGGIKWSFKTQNIVKSTCVLYEDLIYFGSYDKHVYCINEAGNLVWKTYLDTSVLSEVLGFQNNVFVCGTSGGIWSLNKSNGGVDWCIKTKPIFSNPFIFNDLIVITPVVGGIDFIDFLGNKVRHVDIEGHIFSSSVVFCSKIYLTADSLLYIIDNSVQSIPLSSRSVSSVSFLDLSKNWALIPSTNGDINLVDLKKKNSKIVYEIKGDVFSSPVVFPSGKVFIGSRDDNVYCFNIKLN